MTTWHSSTMKSEFERVHGFKSLGDLLRDKLDRMEKERMANQQRFWIVLRDQHSMFASFRHPTREFAKTEALRLANLHQGTKFFVATVNGFAEIPQQPITGWTELEKLG